MPTTPLSSRFLHWLTIWQEILQFWLTDAQRALIFALSSLERKVLAILLTCGNLPVLPFWCA